jgi:hypothetical protein
MLPFAKVADACTLDKKLPWFAKCLKILESALPSNSAAWGAVICDLECRCDDIKVSNLES